MDFINYRMMKILVLAGGTDQIDLIKELKQRQHNVVLVDYIENAPAKPYADFHFVESTLDVEKVKEIAIAENVDLICTACTDQALLTMAKVSEELNLPCYLSYQTASDVTNKSCMKKVLMSHNIPTSKYMIVKDVTPEVVHEIDFLEYPLVVKPVDCNSSKGVVKVENKDALLKALSAAIELSRTHSAVVEEFKEGREISVDFYIEGNVPKFLCATQLNKMGGPQAFTITQCCYPAVDAEQERELTQIATSITEALRLEDCPLLIQLIYSKGRFYVLEFSARMGGGSKHKMVEKLTGVDLMKVFVDRILGENSTVNPSNSERFAAMNYVYAHNGTFEFIEGAETALRENIISDYFQYKPQGTLITKHETSSDRVFGYLVVAEDERSLHAKIKQADQMMKIIDKNGNDIMMHNLHA